MTNAQRCCLQAIAARGGRASTAARWLKPYIDENSTMTEPDVFNQCCDAGWLDASCESDSGSEVCWITPAGRAALETK